MTSASNRQQVQRVLTITLVLNFTVAIGKIIIGLMSGALAITADGLHSIIDGSGNIVALVATRVAARPPDENHPYGHGRYETLAALTIGALLLVTAWEIIRGAIERLGGGEPPEITPLTFMVMLVTLVVNVFVSRYETRAGQRLQSQVLLADAANTRADVLVTLSVLVSMALVVLLGWAWADIVAALLIGVFIFRAAWGVLRQAANILVDTAPYTPVVLTELVQSVPSVDEVVRVRSRGPANATYIDVDVQVAPEMTANQSAAIAGAIRDTLRKNLNGVHEVEVHFEPHRNTAPDYALLTRARADALGLATHEVRLSDAPGGKMLEMHVEVPPDETLEAAHRRVSELEVAVQHDLPEVVNIVSHIEPALVATRDPQDSDAQRQARWLETQVMRLLQSRHPGLDWHDLRVQPYEHGFAAAMHVTLPPQMSVEAAHRIAESAETLLRAEAPQLERVIIHTEPPEDEA